jgi:hypothetical protein
MLRVWDLVFFEGSKALFRVSLALLRTHRKKLDDLVTAISQGLIDPDVGTDEALVALRQMPDDTFDCDRLMSCAVHEISSLPRALLVKLRTHNSRRVLAHGKLEQVFVKQSRELFNLQVMLREQCVFSDFPISGSKSFSDFPISGSKSFSDFPISGSKSFARRPLHHAGWGTRRLDPFMADLFVRVPVTWLPLHHAGVDETPLLMADMFRTPVT